MTKDQILNYTDADLPGMAGEVLLPKSRHAFNMCGRCIDCNQYKRKADEFCKKTVQLHWSTAMKWRVWAVEKFGASKFVQVMYDIIRHELGRGGMLEIIAEAQPSHYIKAAMLCMAESEGE